MRPGFVNHLVQLLAFVMVGFRRQSSKGGFKLRDTLEDIQGQQRPFATNGGKGRTLILLHMYKPSLNPGGAMAGIATTREWEFYYTLAWLGR